MPLAATLERIDWPAALAHVLEDPSEIGVAFQPIVDLARGQVTGYELLARFGGPVQASPDRWFAAAAAAGVGDAFEAAVLSRTLAARAGTPPNCFTSVNVSPDALLSPEVQAVLAATPSFEATVIEITEQAEVTDYGALVRALGALRERGAFIAVDDAGAGYASLSHIMELRPDFVKLDRGLVSDADTDAAKLAALEMLGAMAGRIDAWVIAEGVERHAELSALVRAGVPLGQGYHLGRPAAGMGAIDAGLAARLRSEQATRDRVGGLAPLLERAPAVHEAHAVARAAELLLADARLETVVALDARERPVGMVRRDDAGRGGVRPVMLVAAADAPAAVARRAMSRPPWRRFDPVVCCDARGRYGGVVTLEHLVAEITR